MSPLVFLALTAIELPLIWLATERQVDGTGRQSAPRLARLGIFAVPLAFALGIRAYQGLFTPDVLEWDETYYFSQAVTAAAGRGLYPYVFGYSPMPILGGQGYAAYVYALAVVLAGPTLPALRAVSLVASGVALFAFWLLVRRLYGSGAASIGVVVFANLRLFILANSIRMDSFTLMGVTAALLIVAKAFSAGTSRRWHFLAGLAFGAGLQFHLDSIVTFGACGLLYAWCWLKDIRARGMTFPASLALYTAGWLVGLAAFVCFNILPDPDAFYRTTVQIRVDATSWYSAGTSSVAGSFFNPGVVLAKELVRYGILARALHPLEIALFAAAIAATIIRRQQVDTALLIVIAGVFILSAVVLNNASPLYFIHVLPALVVPVGALLSHGLTGQGQQATFDLSRGSLAVFAVVAAALCAVNPVKSIERSPRAPTDPEVLEFVAEARRLVSPSCRVAGDGDLYVRHFADYPFFVSLRPTEVSYAVLFHRVGSEHDYWNIKRPGAIVTRAALSEALRAYATRAGLAELARGIWVMPSGCTPSP